MKTIDLTIDQISVHDLLETARNEAVVIKSTDGMAYILSTADEFATEVELLRQNHKFLTLLDRYKQDQRTLSLEEVEKRLA